MLHFIRERAQGWVAWFIVGLITIPFALWGVNSYLNGPSEVVVAKVNGEAISQSEYQTALQQYRDRMRSVLEENYDPALFESPTVKQQVLDRLIVQKLLFMVGLDSGLRVTDAALRQIIVNTPAFQKDGKFNREQYELLLRRAGLTPARYEAQLKRDTIIGQLTQPVQRAAFTTPFEINQVIRLEKQMREIAYGVIDATAYRNQVSVSDNDVQDYYKTHAAEFMAPERVSVDYIKLSVADLAKNVKVDEQALHDFYANNQDMFVGPPQRRASHILIEGDEKTALKKISEIKQKLAAGEDFAKLAKAYSHDAGSAANGGDLGYFQRGVMDSAFDKAVFAIKEVGQVVGPIKTEFGYHLIKLTGIKPGAGQSFSEARSEVEQRYRLQKAEDEFYDKADKLADLSYENPDSLDVAAQELGLSIQTTEAFPRTGGTTDLTKNKKFLDAAFSEDVLANDLNSAVVELDKSDLVVLHKHTHIPAKQLPLDAVAPAIKEQLKFKKAVELAKKEGEKRLAKLKAGEPGDVIFGKDKWQDKQLYSRHSKGVSQQILQHAFAMPRPKAHDVFEGFTAANGNYIVLQLSAVLDGGRADNPNKATKDEIEAIQNHLERNNGETELQALIDTIKQQADIEIFQQNL